MAAAVHPCDALEHDIQLVHESIDNALGPYSPFAANDQDTQPPKYTYQKRAKLVVPRWSISRVNLQKLEMIFKEVRTPSLALRQHLSHEMGVTPRQIQVWFRNRRQRVRLAALAGTGSSGDSTVLAEDDEAEGGGGAAAADCESAPATQREGAREFEAQMTKMEFVSKPKMIGFPTADPVATAASMPVNAPSAGVTTGLANTLPPHAAPFRVPAPYGAHAHASMLCMPHGSAVQMPSANSARLQATEHAYGATPAATRPATPRRVDEDEAGEDDRVSRLPSSPSSHGSSECTFEHSFSRGSSVDLYLSGGDRKPDDTASSFGSQCRPYPTPDAVPSMLPAGPRDATFRAVDNRSAMAAQAHYPHLVPPAIAGAGAKLAPWPPAAPTNAPPAHFHLPMGMNGTYTTRDVVERTVRMLMAAVPQAYHPPGCELTSLQPACQVPPVQAPYLQPPPVAHQHRGGSAQGPPNPVAIPTCSGFVPHIPGAMALMAQMAARHGHPSNAMASDVASLGEQPPRVPGGHAAMPSFFNYAQVAPAPPMPMPPDPYARRALEEPAAKRTKPMAQQPPPTYTPSGPSSLPMERATELSTERATVGNPAPKAGGVMVSLDSLDLCQIFAAASPENDDLFEDLFHDD